MLWPYLKINKELESTTSMYEIIFYYLMEWKMSLSKQQTLSVNHSVSTNKSVNTISE